MVTPPEIQGCVDEEEEEEEEEEEYSYSAAGDAASDLDSLAFGAQASPRPPALAGHSPFFAQDGKGQAAASPRAMGSPLEARSLPLFPSPTLRTVAGLPPLWLKAALACSVCLCLRVICLPAAAAFSGARPPPPASHLPPRLLAWSAILPAGHGNNSAVCAAGSERSEAAVGETLVEQQRRAQHSRLLLVTAPSWARSATCTRLLRRGRKAPAASTATTTCCISR
jgi:hypothetical protein